MNPDTGWYGFAYAETLFDGLGCTPTEFRARTNPREKCLFDNYVATKAAIKEAEARARQEQASEAEQVEQNIPNEAPTQSAHQRRSPPG